MLLAIVMMMDFNPAHAVLLMAVLLPMLMAAAFAVKAARRITRCSQQSCFILSRL